MEILIVLGVIALLSGMMIMNSEAMLSGMGPPPLEELVHKAVRQARYEAAVSKKPVELTFDHGKGLLVISSGGSEITRYESGYGEDAPQMSMTFYQLLPDRGDNVGSPFRFERAEVQAVIFHPDRSSTPFEVEITDDGETILQRYDPFSDGLQPTEP